MKLPSLVALALVLSCGLPNFSFSADIARLEWGNFIIEDDSSNGWANFKSLPSDDGRSVRMTFAPLDAKADGSTLETKSKLSGHFDIIQPELDTYKSCEVTIVGHIIKSNASLARLAFTIGPAQNTIEWAPGESVSEKFTRSMTVELSDAGRLPNPFMVSIEAYARKDGTSDAAFVSIDTITITAADAKIAAQ